MSLTQKNEELEMIEDKLERMSKQQHLVSQSAAMELESQRKQHAKEAQTKEAQIQALNTELSTLKELIDQFEEQKQALKHKLEQETDFTMQLQRQLDGIELKHQTQIKVYSTYCENFLGFRNLFRFFGAV